MSWKRSSVAAGQRVSIAGEDPVKGLLNDGPTSLCFRWRGCRFRSRPLERPEDRVGRKKGRPVHAFLQTQMVIGTEA